MSPIPANCGWSGLWWPTVRIWPSRLQLRPKSSVQAATGNLDTSLHYVQLHLLTQGYWLVRLAMATQLFPVPVVVLKWQQIQVAHNNNNACDIILIFYYWCPPQRVWTRWWCPAPCRAPRPATRPRCGRSPLAASRRSPWHHLIFSICIYLDIIYPPVC